MSIKVWGVFELNARNKVLQEQVDLSFLIVMKAAENKIAIKLGGNITSYFLKKLDSLEDKIPFELIDYPMDVNAHRLFIGNGIELQISGIRVDNGDSLTDRMLRVQKLFEEILETNLVKRIELNVNIEEGDEFETIEIYVWDFCNKITQLYEQEGNWTPTVRMIIKKR